MYKNSAYKRDKEKEEQRTAILKDKYAITIGNRDGVPRPAIKERAKTADAKMVYFSIGCLVWASIGAMDPGNQKRVSNISEEHGLEDIVVLLGAVEAEAAGPTAEAATAGDSTYTGPLTGVQLRPSVYHTCEDEMKAKTDPVVYEEQVGMMEIVMDVPAIHEEMEDIRKECCRY